MTAARQDGWVEFSGCAAHISRGRRLRNQALGPQITSRKDTRDPRAAGRVQRGGVGCHHAKRLTCGHPLPLNGSYRPQAGLGKRPGSPSARRRNQWSLAASSGQQRARVLANVKGLRSTPLPLRGADGSGKTGEPAGHREDCAAAAVSGSTTGRAPGGSKGGGGAPPSPAPLWVQRVGWLMTP